MPVWAAVVIALISGISGGLLGTLAKIADERGAEVRRATIDATQDFAALATDWFDLVEKAITAHEKHIGVNGDQEQEEAESILKQGRTRLDRLAVLVGPNNLLVRSGASTLNALSEALRVLPGPMFEADLLDLNDDEIAALDMDEWEERQEEAFDERITMAKALHRHALDRWAAFATVAAAELRRGLVPSLRADARIIRRAARRT